MSVVTLGEVRALVKSGLSDPDLQAVIDREESWLADRIGALTGERTDTFTPGVGDASLYLRRKTAAVVITDAGVTLDPTDFLFTPSTGQIRRVVGYISARYMHVPGAWQGDVTATYTPTDTASVARAVIELVRGTIIETGYESESMGDYSYNRGKVGRAGLVRSILLRRPAHSLRIRSAMEPA